MEPNPDLDMYVLLFHKESDMLLIDECSVEPFLEVCEFVESFQEFKNYNMYNKKNKE